MRKRFQSRLVPGRTDCQSVLHGTGHVFHRRGLVIVAVLVVVVILSLAAYNYANWMTTEYKASASNVREAQCLAAAQSGIHYAMGVMADSGDVTSLNGNPYDNYSVFQAIPVTSGDVQPHLQAKFCVISPRLNDPQGAMGPAWGILDECSKINLNAIMVADPTGNTLYNDLMGLPNMTDPIASSIVFWLDPTATFYGPNSTAADNSVYSGMTPAYTAKNGPINTIEELLLVAGGAGMPGVTPQLLFGDDINRNGLQDGDEQITDPSGFFGRGWSAFLTIYSREQNISMEGLPRIWLNDNVTDINTQLENLTTALGGDMATYIILARLNGTTPVSTATTTTAATTTGMAGGGAGGGGGGGVTTVQATLGSYSLPSTTTVAQATNNINSIYSLINTTVNITTATTNGKSVSITTSVYTCPLNDTSELSVTLPLLLDQCTVNQNSTLLGRININTATMQVLTALGTSKATAAGATPTPILQATDVQNILNAQPVYAYAQSPDPSFLTPAWLLINGVLTPQQMVQLDPYITTYSQVYSFQSVGYFDDGGPVVRMEAVIDINPVPNLTGGTGIVYNPRILYQRPITQLGKGYDIPSLLQNQ